VSNLIAHNLKNSFGGKSNLIKGDVFHVFGFDVLLDEQLKAWILEINEYPSFNIYFETEGEEDENIMSQVDLHVKKNVMNDALKIAILQDKKNIEVDGEN
jgi:hypothetical protein